MNEPHKLALCGFPDEEIRPRAGTTYPSYYCRPCNDYAVFGVIYYQEEADTFGVFLSLEHDDPGRHNRCTKQLTPSLQAECLIQAVALLHHLVAKYNSSHPKEGTVNELRDASS